MVVFFFEVSMLLRFKDKKKKKLKIYYSKKRESKGNKHKRSINEREKKSP